LYDKNVKFLEKAILLGSESMQTGGGPFGAVIVKNDDIVAIGVNEVVKAHDPTAHAEIVAIRSACKDLKTHDLSGCTIYSSCEPCPMCLGALYWARIDCIFYASTRHDAANAGFDDSLIYDELALASENRSITMKQLILPSANAVFENWKQKTDKTMY